MGESVEAIRARLRSNALAGKDKTSGTGNYINPGARYVLEVTAAKVFKGYKSDSTGVIEFKVLETTNTETKEVYEARKKFPNQPGGTVSISNNLNDPYLCGLFMLALAEIAHCTVEDLCEEVTDAAGKKTGDLTFHTLLQIGDSSSPSALVGVRVACEAFDRQRAGKSDITKTKWSRLPVPAEHPLAAVLNAQ